MRLDPDGFRLFRPQTDILGPRCPRRSNATGALRGLGLAAAGELTAHAEASSRTRDLRLGKPTDDAGYSAPRRAFRGESAVDITVSTPTVLRAMARRVRAPGVRPALEVSDAVISSRCRR
jgi:hypothetical protein